MKAREWLLVLAVVAIVSSTLAPTEKGGDGPVALATRTPQKTDATPPPKNPVQDWSVNGARASDSFDKLVQRYGDPTEDRPDDQYRFTVFETPGGALRRVDFQDTQVIALSGDRLELAGQLMVSSGDTAEHTLAALGAPLRKQEADDHVAWQYDGARVYLRDGTVFGVVVEAEVRA